MDSTTILLWVLIGFTVIFVIIGIFYWFSSSGPSTDPTIYTDQYLPFGFWGVPTLNDDPDRNQCHLYQFTAGTNTSSETTCGQQRGLPGQPTLDPSILDQMNPLPVPGCYDIDQVVAVKVNHTCITTDDLDDDDFSGVNAEGEKGISFCTKFDGTTEPVGGTESYYTQNSSLYEADTDTTISVSCSTQPCAGTLALYGLNYKTFTYDPSSGSQTPIEPVCPGNNSSGFGIRCIKTDGDGNFTSTTCSLGDPNQLFRVTRADPGQSIPSTGATKGNSGLLAQIFSRVDNACLTADATGTTLLTGDCQPDWALVPFIGGSEENAVQQTVYIGGLTEDQIEQLTDSVSTPDDLLQNIQTLGLRSIQLESNGSVALKPYATYTISNFNDDVWMADTQIINYTLYNSILFTTNQYSF